MDKTKESLSIRLLDSHSNPLKNQEFRLFEVQNGRRSIINTIFTSNENGEAFFNAKEVFKEGTQSFEIGLHNTLCYKRKPIYNHRYLLRNYEYGYLCEVKFAKKADDASIEKVTLKPKEYLLDNNEKIILKFYAGGDIVELEAFYDVTKIQEDEIKWGYTLLTASSQEHSKNREHSKNLDTLNKNQLTNDKKDSSLFDDKISTTCCHIEKRGDIAILSGTPIDMMQDNPQAYRGKTIQIALPKTTNQQAILIFAYKNTPNYRASQLIRLNDYPQITIDCTLAETLRAYTRQDNIATLGWGVSYVCQRLWHDNPSDAKELSKLIYRDSHSPDFIESIPNATMQRIVKEVLPRITLQEFSIDKKRPRHKARFYVELDWDRFYMQFPIMQELEKEYKNLRERFGRESDFQKQFKDFINDTLPDIESITDSQEYTMALNTQAMRENKTKNKEVFKLYKKEESLAESHRTIQDLQKPSEIIDNSLYFQRFDIDNNVFLPHLGLGKLDAFPLSKSPIQHKNEILNKFHSSPTYKQNFALYSIAGTFNILYIPSHIQIARVTKTYDYHFSFLYAVCKKVRAFIIDTVNFNNDGDSDQPIGVWDYENVGFDLYNSIMQYKKAFPQEKFINFDIKHTPSESFLFSLYNSNFKKSQIYFNLGLDFFLYSSTFLDMDFSATQIQDTAIIMRK